MKLLEIQFKLEDDRGRTHQVSGSFDRDLGFQQWGAIEDALYETWPVMEYLSETERDDVRVLLFPPDDEEE